MSRERRQRPFARELDDRPTRRLFPDAPRSVATQQLFTATSCARGIDERPRQGRSAALATAKGGAIAIRARDKVCAALSARTRDRLLLGAVASRVLASRTALC